MVAPTREGLVIASTVDRRSMISFVEAIIDLLGNQYLRRPTQDDLQRLLHIGEIRGFPGMIGSVDCMHWEWKNCPTAWKGQYYRGSGKPTIVLEAFASYDLWIWQAFFGLPGTLNDIKVLDRSPVFDDIIQGYAPNVTFSVNGRQYHMAHIFSQWKTVSYGLLCHRWYLSEMDNFYPINFFTTSAESSFICSMSRSCQKRCRACF